jgi:hypothetical protein
MPVGIVQVMNNTNKTLHYKNNESGHTINLDPKSHDCCNNCTIPCSDFYDDTVPYKSSNHIDAWLDDGIKVEISDDDWKFYVCGPAAYSKESEGNRYGSLANGGKYILRVDKVDDGKSQNAGITIYKYDAAYKSCDGCVGATLISDAEVCVGTLLMHIL